MSGYKTRTAGTPRPTRDLNVEAPLGVLAPTNWYDTTINKISVSALSVDVTVIDKHKDTLTTKVFIHQYDDNKLICERLKALLACVCADHNEVMTMADMILDGDYHVLGTLVGRKLRCQVGMNGTDIDIIQFARPTKKSVGGGFPF